MAKKRMTRKDLKEPDEILSFLQKCSMFIAQNQTQVIAGVVLFFLVVGGIYGYTTYRKVKELNENARLWELVSEMPEKRYSLSEEENRKLVITKSQLEELERTVSTDTVSLYTKYYIADINYRLGYYNGAVEKYREVLSIAGDVEELKYLCHLGAAYSLEALGNYKEANRHFKSAGEVALDPYNKGVALSGVARSYELMGNIEEAKTWYKKIIEDLPEYPERAILEIHLASIS